MKISANKCLIKVSNIKTGEILSIQSVSTNGALSKFSDIYNDKVKNNIDLKISLTPFYTKGISYHEE